MTTPQNKPFNVKLQQEGNYFRFYITHPNFKGRIRKRLGDRQFENLEDISFNIRYELGKHFQTQDINKNDVENFIDNYISMNVNCTASIFEYKNDFLNYKKERINKKTKSGITNSTLSGYRTAFKYFEAYLIKNRISSHPSQISSAVLDNFYKYIEGEHNYKVKLHAKLKGFIKYVETVKQLPIDPSYKLSIFTEEYDNQCPDEDDIAIPEEDVQKLIDLRKKFLRSEVKLDTYALSDKIPLKVQEQQLKMKEENLKLCLDCFLFMISTGMYFADIKKSKLFFSTNGNTTNVKYRRAKNGSLCRAIPIQNDGIFIAKDIIEQYSIKNGSNFPLGLSLTHFGKHLDRISSIAAISYKINNKMARKTFASYLFFKKNLPIHYLQILLGHKDIKDTAHYLRISDDDITNEILKWIS